ncbi:IS30 family transposase [Leuconostoc mesenteroides]|jgi:IS30 family transposase|nr:MULTISPECIES: IS30 family transposase [Leuconostoc]KAA8373004.1 IS30 family transposase [Leuconostoc carnosum]MBZ1503150.1 IS30 family transposase [Leuconostoc mesenteroides]MBZ1511270.1 IS30 family transposase [Leuconostoc mesenteroides]MBZ1531613.1 IS30 family transposase [Leuconostoc mesenteroides]MCH3952943.1 IS30 family transposase [Leuconostoc mesenteroides]
MTSLSSQERTVIQTLLELNYSVRAIARFIKRSPSTVSIEIHQVTPYKAEIAHALALKKRHLRGRHDTLTPAIAVFLNHHIGILKGSPVLIRFFQGIKNAKSITVDRGREFAKYNEIEQKLGIPVYFAHPYSPEERGSNEILNRYVRRFIPKERKIETVSAKELDQINHWINARPMKTLNWQSPRKVFQQFAVFG